MCVGSDTIYYTRSKAKAFHHISNLTVRNPKSTSACYPRTRDMPPRTRPAFVAIATLTLYSTSHQQAQWSRPSPWTAR